VERRLILVLNVGSSTVKYALFAANGSDEQLSRGSIEFESEAGCDAATSRILDELDSKSQLAAVTAVGHRLVHGGTRFREAVAIDSDVRAALRELISLAPNHLPLELRAVDAISRRLPHLPQVACFDTAFHSGLPVRARRFGLPRNLSEHGVVRYGFHGLSYEYIVARLRKSGRLLPKTIVAHLGNGASLVALLAGESVDTSMGMTPTGGIVMSTRSGDLDPGAMLFMMRALGLSVADVEKAVDRDGGLLGISEFSSDIRTLLAARATNPKAAEALDVFTYQARKAIGAYAAALAGLDSLVFTGGVGEHSAVVRQEICNGLQFLGIQIDESRNRASAETISTDGSRVRVDVIATNEEGMIAGHVRRMLAGSTAGR
jgi:acetate kinase